jgi:hypothetical protein
MNLIELSNRMTKLADSLPAIANDIAKAYVVELAADLADATPVDTSTALSNWQVSINTPARDFIDAHNYGAFGSTAFVSIMDTYQLAKIAAEPGLPGQSYWLSNNTPYIIDLNEGTSRQAPAMFIQQTIALSIKKIQPIAKRVINDYRKR